MEKLKDIERKIDDLAVEIDGQGTALDSIDVKMDDGSQKAMIVDSVGDIAEVTDTGNLEISIEELGNNVSSNSNTQLNTTLYDSTGLELKLDGITGGMTTVDYSHHEIHSGSHYYICDVVTLGNGASLTFDLTTPDSAKWSHMTFRIEGTQGVQMLIKEAATIDTPGAVQTPFNSNRNSDNLSGNVLRTGSTFTDEGTEIFNIASGANKIVGRVTREDELVLKQGTVYIFRITNATSLSNDVSYCGNWYEHTNIA